MRDGIFVNLVGTEFFGRICSNAWLKYRESGGGILPC